MLILEFGQVVDIFVNNDPEAVWLVMRRYVTLREDLGHDGVAMLVENTRRGRRKGSSEGGKKEVNGGMVYGMNKLVRGARISDALLTLHRSP